MAESSLDDFFAKKDKSKKKAKAKTVGDVDTGLKSTKKEKKSREKDKQSSSGGVSSLTLNPQEDEEWKDFEEEKEKDYSGLRIQNLQITKEFDEREAAEADDNGDDEDGENRDRRDGASGPWNKSNVQTGSTTTAVSVPQRAEVEKEEPAAKTPARYVPPAQRHAAQTSSTPHFPSSRKKKEAPNVNSEEDFPTLGGGPGKGQQYSTTATGDLIENPHHRKGVNLTLENKFSALQD
ncbi:protein CDV3 [Biomphalaria pfeifferi]|uniref:Protein CDV3 n=1 Tax=Biomphalaria pfeifferi TaxID=112525 RepID=A0AAD8F3Y5_BIOPF|nr:protein CDV3 [Biomphalaria pfeifferi]